MKILVLDDDKDVAESAALYIQQNTDWQAEYSLAVDAAENKLRSQGFDALILDRNLGDKSHQPGPWGDDFFRKIRCDARFSKLAVIFITAYGTPQNSAEMISLGALQYLTKPVPLPILVPVLRASIAWQQARALVAAVPETDLSPADVKKRIQEIITMTSDPSDLPVQILPLDGGAPSSTAMQALGRNKRSVICPIEKADSPMFLDPAARSSVAARVARHDGVPIEAILIESTQAKAFDSVWMFVVECLADALGLSYKLENLRRKVEQELEVAVAEFRHAFNGRLQILKTQMPRIEAMSSAAMSDKNAETLFESWQIVDSTVEKLNSYVQRLSRFSDKIMPSRALCATNDLIETSWLAARAGTEVPGISFRSTVQDPEVVADRSMIEESLFCLFSNALEAIEDRRSLASADGGESDEIAIRVAQSSDGAIEISVTDTGIGVPPELMGKLFIPFHTTKTDRPARRGIGLFTVRRIMSAHGGQATAESAGLGRGSTFTLRFPNP